MKDLIKYGATVGRVFLAILFIAAGYSKIGGYAGTQGFMEKFGVPGELLPVVIALELGGGLALLIGFQTRIVAFLLAGFTLLAALVFHNQLGDTVQYLFFMKNIAIAGGLLALVAHGPGPLGMDKA